MRTLLGGPGTLRHRQGRVAAFGNAKLPRRTPHRCPRARRCRLNGYHPDRHGRSGHRELRFGIEARGARGMPRQPRPFAACPVGLDPRCL